MSIYRALFDALHFRRLDGRRDVVLVGAVSAGTEMKLFRLIGFG